MSSRYCLCVKCTHLYIFEILFSFPMEGQYLSSAATAKLLVYMKYIQGNIACKHLSSFEVLNENTDEQ